MLSRGWKQPESSSLRLNYQRHVSIPSDRMSDSSIEGHRSDFLWDEESDSLGFDQETCYSEHSGKRKTPSWPPNCHPPSPTSSPHFRTIGGPVHSESNMHVRTPSEPLDQTKLVKWRRTTQLQPEFEGASDASSDFLLRAKAIMEAELEKARLKDLRNAVPPTPSVEAKWIKRHKEHIRENRTFSDEKNNELRQQLQRWSHRCPLCHLRQEAEQRHRLQDCVRDEAKQIWRNLEHMRSRVQICKSDFCFYCGLNDSPWDSAIHFFRHDQGGWAGFRPGKWTCQYEGLVLSVIVTVLQECEDDGIIEEVYGWMREDGIEIESEREVFLWLTCKNITRKGDWGHGWDVLMVHRVFHQLARAVKN